MKRYGSFQPPGVMQWLAIVLTALLLAVEVAVHLLWLPPVNHSFTVGSLAECIELLLILAIWLALQLMMVPQRIYLLLSFGFGFWLVSGVADVLDEIVQQPIWVSIYIEDMPRLLGLMLAGWGVYALLRNSFEERDTYQQQAVQDELTGLGNRRYFLEHAQRRRVRGMTVLLLDVDHFKQINDQHGHDAGDEILRRLGLLLQFFCTGSNVPARLGGEEFVVLSNRNEPDKVRRFAEQLRLAVADMPTAPFPNITISIGVVIGEGSAGVSQLLKQADLALYQAKTNGRNQVVMAMSEEPLLS